MKNLTMETVADMAGVRAKETEDGVNLLPTPKCVSVSEEEILKMYQNIEQIYKKAV